MIEVSRVLAAAGRLAVGGGRLVAGNARTTSLSQWEAACFQMAERVLEVMVLSELLLSVLELVHL